MVGGFATAMKLDAREIHDDFSPGSLVCTLCKAAIFSLGRISSRGKSTSSHERVVSTTQLLHFSDTCFKISRGDLNLHYVRISQRRYKVLTGLRSSALETHLTPEGTPARTHAIVVKLQLT